MRQVRCAVLGNPEAEKTHLIATYCANMHPGTQQQSGFDSYTANGMVDHEAFNIQIWDTASQAEYSQARLGGYQQTDVFVLCFSLVSAASLYSIENTWFPELRQVTKSAPVVLVGTHSELRDAFAGREDQFLANNWEPVSRDRIDHLAKKIEAYTYIECSVQTNYHVNEVFEAAVRALKEESSDSSDDDDDDDSEDVSVNHNNGGGTNNNNTDSDCSCSCDCDCDGDADCDGDCVIM